MNAPRLDDINRAISNLMAAERALDEACEVMRLHDEEVVANHQAAHVRLGVLLSRFCRLYGERVKLDGDPALMAEWDRRTGGELETRAVPQ